MLMWPSIVCGCGVLYWQRVTRPTRSALDSVGYGSWSIRTMHQLLLWPMTGWTIGKTCRLGVETSLASCGSFTHQLVWDCAAGPL